MEDLILELIKNNKNLEQLVKLTALNKSSFELTSEISSKIDMFGTLVLPADYRVTISTPEFYDFKEQSEVLASGN